MSYLSFEILKEILDTRFFPEFTINDGDRKMICNERNERFKYRDASLVCGKACAYHPLDNPQARCKCDMMDDTVDDVARLIHYYEIINKLRNEGVRVDINDDCKKVLKKYVSKPKKIYNQKKGNGPGCSWYSIVPEERLDFCPGNIARLKSLCEKCFTEKNCECAQWVVESGKHKSKPNLHIHALVKIGGRNKNFRRFFIGKWNKEFKDKRFNIEYKHGDNVGWKMIPVNCWEMKKDKLSYMNNDSKGSHENFVDLGVSGGFGF